eukprot:3336221-Rhodomonas_salina.1
MWIRNQSKRESVQDVWRRSLLLENVPAEFLYWALGRKWVLWRPHSVHYNPTSEMHTFSRSTLEFVSLFSVDLHCIQNRKAPPGQENNQQYRVGCSVEQDRRAPEGGTPYPDIRLKYSACRPGQLLVLFAQLAKWGLHANRAAGSEAVPDGLSVTLLGRQ